MTGFKSDASKKATWMYAAVQPMIKARVDTRVLSQKRIASISPVSQPSI
jgi:predicted XRE-type DNA-binding protein